MSQIDGKKYYYALTFVSADSRGLVADAAKVFYENGFNIADSSSTLLHGVFSMIFVVTSPKDYNEADIKFMFGSLSIIPYVYKYLETPKADDDLIHFSVSLYGADKAGIVSRTASCLAKNGVNIVDLQTKITGKIYIMIFEVTLPPDADLEKWQVELAKTATELGTEVSVKKIEFYEL